MTKPAQMKQLLSVAIAMLGAITVHGQSTFTGSLLSGQNSGAIAGGITITVDRGQASFTCLLLSSISPTNLEAALGVRHRVIPIDLGTGTPGSWTLQEFLAPGIHPFNPCAQMGIDPGFLIPLSSEGTQFTGLLNSFPGLENALRVGGGTVFLRVPASPQEQLFAAPLAEVVTPTTNHFAAILTRAALSTGGREKTKFLSVMLHC